MSTLKCAGCIDPITKFIELHRNPSILCDDCQKSENLYSNEIACIGQNPEIKPEKKLKKTAKLWNTTLKYSVKLGRSLNPNFQNFKFRRIKSTALIMDKLKKIFDKSEKQDEISKIIRSLYKTKMPGDEKIKYLKNKGGEYLMIGEFFESLEITMDTHLFNERQANK